MINKILIEPHYLPNIEFFAFLLFYDQVKFTGDEAYKKQTYRNRCHILTSQKIDKLIIPIVKKSSTTLFKEIEIDYRSNWYNYHWKAIKTSYSNSPFFEFYKDALKKIIFQQYQFLFDLNIQLINKFLEILKIKKQVSYGTETNISTKIVDGRNIIKTKEDYFNREIYIPYRYNQTFGNSFIPNLSILDLIFNKGPQSQIILKKSAINQAFLS